MNGFSSWSRRRRQAVLGGCLAVGVIAGVSIYTAASDDSPRPLNVDFVLGGGDNVTAKGPELAIRGQFRGLAVAPDNTTYLFTQDSDDAMVMWRKKPSGPAERIQVSGMSTSHTATQTAVAPDGSIYLAAKSLWKVSPTGKAREVISQRPCKKASVSTTSLSDFCAAQITGVTVTKDGTVYIGDQLPRTPYGSYVHKIMGQSVELVAGRPPKTGESTRLSDPAVRNGVNPRPATRAKNIVVIDPWNSGALAPAKDGGLYWKTGPGIVHINEDGTLSPFVAAKSPGKVSEAKGPFDTVGRALDAEIPRSSSDTGTDLAVIPGRDEVYYSDSAEPYLPARSGDFGWRGATSDSQKKLLDESERGAMVHRVSDGKLAPVIAGVQAIATSEDGLYVAVQSDGGSRTSPEDWDIAVVRVRLPE
ncbi:hypothetical protein [Streptomyces alboflavus]|uniref:hypothetical protein n=1 Tax=Streptomyces alboflavus TaxID=67267 RepID=UPI0036B55E44